MALVETHVEASPQRCFEVLSDPRSYEYWVVGSRRIHAADPGWPAVGTRFEHSAGVAPLKTDDHTEVEAAEPDRHLRLRARARPFGTAFVDLKLREEGSGTRLTLEEGPADRLSQLAYSRLLDRLVRRRNETSVARLRELAEGEAAIPSHELPPRREPDMSPAGVAARTAAGFGAGFLAGIAGGVAMSASTVAEMRLTGREPSKVPVQALERLFSIRVRGKAGEQRLTTASHFLVAGLTGGIWGSIAKHTPGGRYSTPLLFTAAALPDVAVVPALGLAPPLWRWSAADLGRTGLHHAVYAATAGPAFKALGG
jgi:uncharacterized protein YndB with AHSA1/START domain